MTGPSEREQLDQLLQLLFQFAEGQLRKHGGFNPFGAVLTNVGEARLVAAYEGDEPESEQVIETIYAGMRDQAARSELLAGGVCYDGRVRGDEGTSDAVVVALEHQTGEAAVIFVPYTVGGSDGPAFGAMRATRGDQRIFGP
jgi:hypothetical protein